jgi:membrane protease YdiL (CAAX protease family)
MGHARIPLLRRPSYHLGGLELDSRLVWLYLLGSLVIVIDHYHCFSGCETSIGPLLTRSLEKFGYFFLAPALLIRLVFGERLHEYGLQIGDWRAGLRWTAISLAIVVPVLYLASGLPSVQVYYKEYRPSLDLILIDTALDLFSWEFFIRGFILFGLLKIFGPGAVLVQALIFTLMHLGKPEIETLSCIFSGVVFGWIAWRSKSMLYPFLIHYGIAVSVYLRIQGFW